MWEQSVDAGLRLGRIEHENSLAVFLLHGVIAGNGYLAESGIGVKAIAKDGVVGGIGDNRDRSRAQETGKDQSPQKTADSGFQRGTHGCNYNVAAATQIADAAAVLLIITSVPHLPSTTPLTTRGFDRQTTESSFAGFRRAPTGHSRGQVRV